MKDAIRLEDLVFQLFSPSDFPEYLTWFEDPTLHKYLGPMDQDDEWLTAVRKENYDSNENNSKTYSIFLKEVLVGVIGIDMPTDQYPYFIINSIAIKPEWRGRGYGQSVLKGILNLHKRTSGERWRTYIAESNRAAQSFFVKNGWTKKEEKGSSDQMICYEF